MFCSAEISKGFRVGQLVIIHSRDAYSEDIDDFAVFAFPQPNSDDICCDKLPQPVAPSAAEGSKSERLPCAVSSPCILLCLRMLHQWWKVKQGTAKCTDTSMLCAAIVDESEQQNVQ